MDEGAEGLRPMPAARWQAAMLREKLFTLLILAVTSGAGAAHAQFDPAG